MFDIGTGEVALIAVIALLVLAGFLTCSSVMMLMLGNPARKGNAAGRFEQEKGVS